MFNEHCILGTSLSVVPLLRYLAQKKVPKALELVERGTLHLLEAKQVSHTHFLCKVNASGLPPFLLDHSMPLLCIGGWISSARLRRVVGRSCRCHVCNADYLIQQWITSWCHGSLCNSPRLLAHWGCIITQLYAINEWSSVQWVTIVRGNHVPLISCRRVYLMSLEL